MVKPKNVWGLSDSIKPEKDIWVLNGDVPSDEYEFVQNLTNLPDDEYMIKVTVSGGNLSIPLIRYFNIKIKDSTVSMNIRKDGEKWLERMQ